MCFGLESSPRLQYKLSKVNYSPAPWGLVSHLSTYKSPRIPHVSPGSGGGGVRWQVHYRAERKPIGSKRWLKTWWSWNLQPHNRRFAVQRFMFAKLQWTVYKRAMPQSLAAAIVWFQTAKNKNTKQTNQKTNMNKTAVCGFEFIVCMTFKASTAALLDTRKAVTQFIQRPLAPTGQKKSVAVLRCSRGFY